MHNRRQPVGDDERRAVARHLIQRVLDLLLGVTVEGACRLIENEDRRALEDSAGDGDALLLAPRQL
jgi:hypothetical protein